MTVIETLVLTMMTFFIPFKTEGSTVYFGTFVPTDSELNTCPHIILTGSDTEWDPQGVVMNSNRPYGDNDARISATNAGESEKPQWNMRVTNA